MNSFTSTGDNNLAGRLILHLDRMRAPRMHTELHVTNEGGRYLDASSFAEFEQYVRRERSGRNVGYIIDNASDMGVSAVASRLLSHGIDPRNVAVVTADPSLKDDLFLRARNIPVYEKPLLGAAYEEVLLRCSENYTA